MALKLEGQQWYRTRGGDIAFCIGKAPLERDDSFVVCVGAIPRLYFEDGDFIRVGESGLDLTEHLPDCTGFDWVPPKPAHVYKVGDWVKVTKPANTSEYPGWYLGMDPLENKTLPIKYVLANNECVKFSGSNYSFSTKWLEPAEEPNRVYRPFANAAEFEPHKDRWILRAYKGEDCDGQWRVNAFNDVGVFSRDCFFTYPEMLEMEHKFADGTPFGVLVNQ